MMRLLVALILVFGLLAAVHAEERILAYDSTVTIQADGSLEVEERIRVRAEGQQIRRGITRDFPTRYKDRYGNAVVVDFTVLEVLRDGHSEPWFTESRSNGIQINTGSDDFLPVPAEYTYTLRFRTTRQVGFFKDHDELYWNAIGTGSIFSIDSGQVEVRLPQAVPTSSLDIDGYTGPQGSKAQNFVTEVIAPDRVRWQLSNPLAAHEGLTIVLGFPKGLIAEPTLTQRLGWFFRDNRGVLLALAGCLLMLVYMVRRWHQVGRDPKPGIIITRYEPPPGYSPAALRFIQNMGSDNRCVTADLLALAVAGLIRIERNKGRLLGETWSLHKLDGDASRLTPSQQKLLSGLFAKGSPLELKDENHRILQSAILAHMASLEQAYNKRLFHRNFGSATLAFLIGALSIGLGFAISGGNGMVALVVLAVLAVVAQIAFLVLIRAPTQEGRRVLDEIEGLKRYLSVAEREDLARLQGPDVPPQLDAERFQQLLPYAVALKVEDAWTRKFTLAVGASAAAAASASVSWYHGSSITDMASLTQAVGKNLSARIASASTPPGSSSGGGGGGSSGGGGGGGGVGGR